jgi:hypothetical protein
MLIPFSDIDKKLIESFPVSPLGLANGKMGFCLYFYILGKSEKNRDYITVGSRLLDDMWQEMRTLQTIDVKNGLAGIGLSMYYLVKNGFIKGNINTVLDDIDDVIFKRITSNNYYDTMNLPTLIHLLYYWYIRLQEQREGSETQWLYKELSIQLINEVYKKADYSFCEAPLSYTVDYPVPQFLYVLSKFYRLGFYSVRIKKIFNEFSCRLFSSIPLLHANRLYLLWGLDAIKKSILSNKLNDYILLIRNELNLESIFDSELRSRNVFFVNGYPSVFLLFNALKEYFSESDCQKFTNTAIRKCIVSDIWDVFADDPYYFSTTSGLIDGYCGTSLFLRMINR